MPRAGWNLKGGYSPWMERQVLMTITAESEIEIRWENTARDRPQSLWPAGRDIFGAINKSSTFFHAPLPLQQKSAFFSSSCQTVERAFSDSAVVTSCSSTIFFRQIDKKKRNLIPFGNPPPAFCKAPFPKLCISPRNRHSKVSAPKSVGCSVRLLKKFSE